MRFQTLYEGRWIFAVLAILGLAGWFVSPWLSLLFFLLVLYTIAFFRDPDRVAPPEASAIVAAADGVVADVGEIDEPDVVKSRSRRVGVFISGFGGHTTRAPVGGRAPYR